MIARTLGMVVSGTVLLGILRGEARDPAPAADAPEAALAAPLVEPPAHDAAQALEEETHPEAIEWHCCCSQGVCSKIQSPCGPGSYEVPCDCTSTSCHRPE